MKNLGQGKRRSGASCRFVILLVNLYLILAATASVADDRHCPASEAYLAEMVKHLGIGSTNKNSSCLIDFPSIRADLSSYQLVDIRSASTPLTQIANAWQIPVTELRTKSFLKNKPLLLLGEGFSRAQAANDCDLLKKAGFQQTKILIGGVDTWQAAIANKHTRTSPPAHKTVSVEQLVFEYFNGQVTLLTTLQEQVNQLKALNITAQYIPSSASQAIVDIAIEKGDRGLTPIVVMGGDNVPDRRAMPLPNVYRLDGGVEDIRQYLEKIEWTNFNRMSVPRRYTCGNA